MFWKLALHQEHVLCLCCNMLTTVQPFVAQPASVAQGHAARTAAPVLLTEAFGWLAAL